MPTFAASRLVTGPFDEGVIREASIELREKLSGKPTFGIIFATPDYAEHSADLIDLVRVYGHVPALVGCTANGLVATHKEVEEGSGFSLMLVSIPGGRAEVLSLNQNEVESSTRGDFWRKRFGGSAAELKAWFAFTNPHAFHTETWLKQWNHAFPGVPVFGAYAGGFSGEPEAWVFGHEGIVPGGVALALSGEVEVHSVVSQACKPIGEPLTVTQAEKNILLTLGSRPAYEVLCEVYKELSESEREQARNHLFAGLALSEYLEEYKRGDFLVRNIIGADQKSGAVAINAVPRVGQTLQYQLRDPEVATEEFKRLLRTRQNQVQPYAGILCTCHGRGRGLFGVSDHDAQLINAYFPDLPLAGLFSNVQIGPSSERSFAHGYTASLALLAEPTIPQPELPL